MRASCVPPEHSHTGASATTCAGATPTGALLAYDNEGRLTAWQNLANVTTTPISTPALEEALYDGEGQRVQQLDFGVRSREHDSSVSDQLNCSVRERILAQIGHE